MTVEPRQAPEPRGSQHCITCGDDGQPMVVVRLDRDRGLALCTAQDGQQTTVETELVGPVAVGDRLLVHAGVALVALEEPAEHRSCRGAAEGAAEYGSCRGAAEGAAP